MFRTWTWRSTGRRECRPPHTAPSRSGRCRPAGHGRRCWAESAHHKPAGLGGPVVTTPGLEHAFREEWTAVVASLARRLGDLQAAEDAAAEAFATAARVWERDGVPPNPGGWLTVT